MAGFENLPSRVRVGDDPQANLVYLSTICHIHVAHRRGGCVPTLAPTHSYLAQIGEEEPILEEATHREVL